MQVQEKQTGFHTQKLSKRILTQHQWPNPKLQSSSSQVTKLNDNVHFIHCQQWDPGWSDMYFISHDNSLLFCYYQLHWGQPQGKCHKTGFERIGMGRARMRVLCSPRHPWLLTFLLEPSVAWGRQGKMGPSVLVLFLVWQLCGNKGRPTKGEKAKAFQSLL